MPDRQSAGIRLTWVPRVLVKDQGEMVEHTLIMFAQKLYDRPTSRQVSRPLIDL